ncbi:MAG: acetylxylan esterase [Isosphaeraceae bacterium]
MNTLSRRDLLTLGLAGPAAAALLSARVLGQEAPADVDQQILDLAARFERERRARFAQVASKADLESLQNSLRSTFLKLLGGLPRREGGDVPRVTVTGQVDGDGYTLEKLAYESFPGYFVPALLYRPKRAEGRAPGVLSPCGHSAVGKAADDYQILHVNLAKRGCVVLTYDPVGQGERSQFWDAARKRTRFNLGCGEHAVIGNALYLLGGSLATYRIWDGMRGLDLLASLPEVDPARLGCVGNSGGGTLTSYISALDPRVAVAAISCYITTLPRRMANRIQEDPSSDPEQDIHGFVSEGIDHAGLLALRAPKPTLVCSARLDFFPIEGARASFVEAKRLYETAGAGDRIAQAESPARHGLTLPLREAVYGWFGRWLLNQGDGSPEREIPVKPRPAGSLNVCADGQAAVTLRSRPLLPMALEHFRTRPKSDRKPLREVLRIDLDAASPVLTHVGGDPARAASLVLCVNGNETPDWREQKAFLDALVSAGHAVAVVDPRGAGARRLNLTSRGGSYADPISGVEENVAYNAFLVGESLMGLRVSDVLAAVRQARSASKPRRVILCGRRDAALVALFAAAVDSTVDGLAAEELLPSYLPMFSPEGLPLNAASVVPGLLRDFGDIPEVLAAIAPRPVLTPTEPFTGRSRPILEWMKMCFQ